MCVCNEVRVRENDFCVPGDDDDDDDDEYDGDDDDDDDNDDDDDDDYDDDDYDDDEETAGFITTFDRRIVCTLTIKPFTYVVLSGYWSW